MTNWPGQLRPIRLPPKLISTALADSAFGATVAMWRGVANLTRRIGGFDGTPVERSCLVGTSQGGCGAPASANAPAKRAATEGLVSIAARATIRGRRWKPDPVVDLSGHRLLG